VVHDGAGRILHYGDTLSIAMQSEPGKRGYARIDGFKTIDLTEEQPGFYTAKYNIAPADNLSGAAVTGVLADDAGLKLTQQLKPDPVTISNRFGNKVTFQ
jgi:hypothetical protein